MKVNESFEYQGKGQNFTRDNFATLAEMKAVKAKTFPDIFTATCSETGKFYIYNKDNEVDEVLGKWREVSGGSSAEEETDTIDFSTWPEFTNPEANGIVLDGQGGANVDGSNVSVDPDDIEDDD